MKFAVLMSRVRNWCWTRIINEQTVNQLINYSDTIGNHTDVRYCIFQLERCPSTQRLHLQGYMELNKSCRMAHVKEILQDTTVHLEVRRGSRDEARDYCRKEESRIEGPFESGTWNKSGSGNRTDLTEIKDKIEAGSTLVDIVSEHFTDYVRYSSGIEKAMFQLRKGIANRIRDVTVICLYGATGTGKTRHAFESFGEKGGFILDKVGSQLWFDGYQMEDTLVIDDFDNWIPFRMLLRLLDRYPVRLNVKGSTTWAFWTKVYITSNVHPKYWFANEEFGPLERRLHKIVDTDVPDWQDTM